MSGKIKKVLLAGLVVLFFAVNVHAAETALTSDNYDHTQPKWSPDGTKIVYIKRDATNYDQIYTIPAGGGAEFAVTSDATHKKMAEWSPDSSTIVYVVQSAFSQIYTVPATGGVQTQLTFSVRTKGNPTYSPDGTLIAYNATHSASEAHIYTIPSGGGAENQLTAGVEEHGGPSWSPDGLWIAFGNGTDGETYKIAWNGGSEIQLTTTGGGSNEWAPSGLQLAYLKVVGSYVQLWRVDSSGGNERGLTTDSYSKNAPKWSPNGYFIVFKKFDVSGYSQIYVMRPFTDALQKAQTSDSFDKDTPYWSPDSTKIVYSKLDATGFDQIYVLDLIAPPPLIPTLSEVGLLILGIILFSLMVFISSRRRVFRDKILT